MEIIGRVKEICPAIEGENEAGRWIKRDLVITVVYNDNDLDYCITFYGERRTAQLASLAVGNLAMVRCQVSSHKYGDRWYTNLDGFVVKKLSESEQS